MKEPHLYQRRLTTLRVSSEAENEEPQPQNKRVQQLFMEVITMKKVLTFAIALVMTFVLGVPANALGISVSNNVYVFEAGAFEAVDGWYVGKINVGWYGNGNNKADMAWAGNEGEVIVTPYTVKNNKQEAGALDIKIQQTTEEQTVVFTLTKINGQKLDATVVVPPLYDGPISFDVLRTADNPGYYFSGALIDMGVTLTAAAVDKDTFYAKAKVTEHNGSVQGSFGNFAWDPEKQSYALGDGWAKWNIVDAYVSDANGNRVDKGNYVKFDIEWKTRTEPTATAANRYDVPATRAAWYTAGTSPFTFIAYASIELNIAQQKEIPGIAKATYVQDETKHDPIFDKFKISDAPGGGTYALYTPDNASKDNKRPILVWFHGTGERYHGANPGGNLIGNRALAFADKEFQEALDGAYVLAPQSTTAGWSANRLTDMEALINKIVAENYVDTDRIYVGGLSMGTGMTIPLITSTTENKINYAAAILCSGGNISAIQAQTIASKGFPVYLVGSTSDGAANNLPASLNNLKAAGVDARMKMFPAGPVFDGNYYYGAHDAWNYIYNNIVKDDNGEAIFQWLAKQSR
jgi:predicted peptidase